MHARKCGWMDHDPHHVIALHKEMRKKKDLMKSNKEKKIWNQIN